MFFDILFFIIGLALILFGANILVDGSAAAARRMGISDLVIGLTIVAFGTSAPELIISLISAINGSAELAVGNVVGSNLFNILAIVGITSLVRPIKVERSILTNEIPLVIVSSLALAFIGLDSFIDGGREDVISRSEALMLLLFFGIFVRYTFSKASSPEPETEPAEDKAASMPVWKSVLYIVGGLVGLIVGGEIFVDGASGIAVSLGVSEAVIGLTIVALGTSLPELATSVVAALKGRQGIAIGNVVGSCLFNVFFVLGVSATVSPLRLGGIGIIDISLLLVASLLFWLFGQFYKERTFSRPEGAILTLIYVGYIAYLIATV
ncbi:MAG: calcium/sodium antiporter [Muribaculaceae bacterium]|nr:calcium/sodium antiporter [Muribaculaceae bacterium]